MLLGPWNFNERRRWWHDCPHVYCTHVFPFMFFWNIFPLISDAIFRGALSTRFSWVDDFSPARENGGQLKCDRTPICTSSIMGFMYSLASSIRKAGSAICCSYIIDHLQLSCSSFSQPVSSIFASTGNYPRSRTVHCSNQNILRPELL